MNKFWVYGFLLLAIFGISIFGIIPLALIQWGERGGSAGNRATSQLTYPPNLNKEEAIEQLKNYISQKKPTSPLAAEAKNFVESGKRYNVNPALMVAIAYHESVLGTEGKGPPVYNPFGWGCGKNDPCEEFSSWAHAIEHVTKAMRNNYFNKGRTTIPSIGAKWAPVKAENDPEGLNQYWVARVSEYFNDIIQNCPAFANPISVAYGECGSKIVSIAQNEIGNEQRRGENQVKYNNWNGEQWCAYFVSWVYKNAGYLDQVIPGTVGLKDYFQKNEYLGSPTQGVLPGDIFWVQASRSNSGLHVGIIKSVSGDKAITIEGNTAGDKVKENTRAISTLLYVARPKSCNSTVLRFYLQHLLAYNF